MTATGHALIGTLLAVQIQNPIVGIPIAFASHILADLMPHWDAGTHFEKKSLHAITLEAIADVVISFVASFALIYYLFPTTDYTYVFLMILSAQGIDWLTAPYIFLKLRMQPFKFFHQLSTSTNTRLDKPWGIITQVAVVAILLLFALL